MRRGRDGRDEPEERDDADWLLGELTGDADDTSVTPAPADSAPATPAEPAASFTPAPGSSAPWSSRRERRDEEADWFTLAQPVPGDAGTANEPSAGDAARPAADAPTPPAPAVDAAPADAAPATPAPGPVTPTTPFALTWGENAPDAEAQPTRYTPPLAARRSFTAPFEDTSQPAAGPQPAEPEAPRPSAPVDDYGAALWSALTEPDEPHVPGTRTPAAPADGALGSEGAAVGTGDSAQEPAAVGGAPLDTPAPAEPEGEAGRPRQPFPAFASARWGDPVPAQPAAGPVADLLGAGSNDASADAGDGDETGAQPAFVWNLTPDPTAADPSVGDDRSRRASSAQGEDATGEDTAGAATGPVHPAEPIDAVAAEPEPEPEPEPVEPEPVESESAPTAVQPTAAAPTRTRPSPAADTSDLAATAVFGVSADAAADVPARAAAAAMPTAPAAPRTVAMPAAGGPGGASIAAPGSGTPTGPTGPRPPAPPRGGGDRRRTRLLLWIAGGLVVAIVLAGLYFLGTQLAGGGGDAAPVATPTPTAEPTPTPEPTGPQAAGVHAWDTLFGGECLDGFTSPWAEEFTVVDCAAPHAAQLVYRGELAEDAAAPFPGEADLGSRMNVLCTAPGVIDVGAASGVNDLQVQGSFPVTEEQWAEGERTYYCFVNRAGGEPLTGSLQGPGPTA